jgi:hypothetical protein
MAWPRIRRSWSAGKHLSADCRCVFSAWIIIGDPNAIRALCGYTTHDRSLRRIAVPAASEDNMKPARRSYVRAETAEYVIECIGGVGVVNIHDGPVREDSGTFKTSRNWR